MEKRNVLQQPVIPTARTYTPSSLRASASCLSVPISRVGTPSVIIMAIFWASVLSPEIILVRLIY